MVTGFHVPSCCSCSRWTEIGARLSMTVLYFGMLAPLVWVVEVSYGILAADGLGLIPKVCQRQLDVNVRTMDLTRIISEAHARLAAGRQPVTLDHAGARLDALPDLTRTLAALM